MPLDLHFSFCLKVESEHWKSPCSHPSQKKRKRKKKNGLKQWKENFPRSEPTFLDWRSQKHNRLHKYFLGSARATSCKLLFLGFQVPGILQRPLDAFPVTVESLILWPAPGGKCWNDSNSIDGGWSHDSMGNWVPGYVRVPKTKTIFTKQIGLFLLATVIRLWTMSEAVISFLYDPWERYARTEGGVIHLFFSCHNSLLPPHSYFLVGPYLLAAAFQALWDGEIGS